MKTRTLILASLLFALSGYCVAQQSNVSLNHTNAYTASNEDGFPGTNTLDGDETTYWQTLEGSDKAYQEIEVELDKVYEISKVIIKWHNNFCAKPWDIVFDIDGAYEGFPKPNVRENPNCILSINHGNYDYAATDVNVLDNDYPVSGYPYYTKPDFPYKAQYVKFYFRGRSGQTHYEVAEIELWGTPEGGSGMEKINNATIRTSPNPVNDVLNISMESTIDYIFVTDMGGKEMEKHTVNANSYSINTTNWLPGTYLVQIVSGKECKTTKVVK